MGNLQVLVPRYDDKDDATRALVGAERAGETRVQIHQVRPGRGHATVALGEARQTVESTADVYSGASRVVSSRMLCPVSTKHAESRAMPTRYYFPVAIA